MPCGNIGYISRLGAKLYRRRAENKKRLSATFHGFLFTAMTVCYRPTPLPLSIRVRTPNMSTIPCISSGGLASACETSEPD